MRIKSRAELGQCNVEPFRDSIIRILPGILLPLNTPLTVINAKGATTRMLRLILRILLFRAQGAQVRRSHSVPGDGEENRDESHPDIPEFGPAPWSAASSHGRLLHRGDSYR